MTEQPEEITPPPDLQVQRINTHMFIFGDPINVELKRQEKEKLPDGGHKFKDAENQPERQIMRLIPAVDVMPAIQTPDGFQRTPTYVLLGEWDADMAIWDKFELNGHDYQIVSPIRPTHTEFPYEKKGDVALL